ncbi:hypothetical protein [Pseudobacteriovorax antillogorgiicola]|uniref:Uncharacterized protein n=1 Tax=Pseudobacteriovorax antillogorgiicola TaxID=1513793 RepID=A0A1Y6BM95_9BACT|nr:hypothetical protein [Pseudobacteriovorax antillogorgiicola]TCS55555.1 hypothetical protein EDD56_105281 [Pseudobacteriovorax antillogorgiicola]SMF11017.1 hypothetical protein SAMN06296036_10543 [Pseudobacteriovorax antillogorgiicola]
MDSYSQFLNPERFIVLNPEKFTVNIYSLSAEMRSICCVGLNLIDEPMAIKA